MAAANFSFVDPNRVLEYAFVITDNKALKVIHKGFADKKGIDELFEKFAIISMGTKADLMDELHDGHYVSYSSMIENEQTFTLHLCYVGHSEIAIKREFVDA